MRIKRFLFIKMPTLTKATPYWKALKVFSIILGLAEVMLLIAAAFRTIAWLEFGQISLGLLVLLFFLPLLFRMSKRLFFVLSSGAILIVFLFLIFQTFGDRYFSQQVFDSYLKGEDYHAKVNSLAIIASSNAIAHTQLVIDEIEFISQGVKEAKKCREHPSPEKISNLISLKAKTEERMARLDSRFSETGYCNKSASANEKTVKSMYHKMLLYLDECLNTDRH